jgi:hypothetical protein
VARLVNEGIIESYSYLLEIKDEKTLLLILEGYFYILGVGEIVNETGEN